MNRKSIGTVKQLFCYPVKSMAGVQVDQLELGPFGAIGDRTFALREKDGRVTSAKRTTQLLEIQASYIETPIAGKLPPIQFTLANGRAFRSDQGDVSQIFSALLGRQVTLERCRADQQNFGELDANTIFADVPISDALEGKKRQLPADADRYDLAPGTFFDSAHLHLLTTGTLAHLKNLIGPDVNLDVRRFRPTVLIESPAGEVGFLEDDWLDRRLIVGDGVEIDEIWPTLRCVMTTVQQDDLPKDLRVLHTVVREHENHLGVFARTGVGGLIKVGDPLYLV